MLFILIKKELRQYFISPIAYILIFFFSLVLSLWTFQFQSFFVRNVADFRPFFSIMPLLFIFLVPAVTMRTWSEEQKSGSDQILLTLPFSGWNLVFGKFFGALILFLVMMTLTAIIPLSLLPLGNFELGVLVSNYIGLMLIIGAEVSIGCFLSALTKNQISNFLLTTLVLLLLTLIGFIPGLVTLPRWLGGSINYLSISTHLQSFIKGLLDTRDIFYYVCVIAVFLFLNRQILVYRKWG